VRHGRRARLADADEAIGDLTAKHAEGYAARSRRTPMPARISVDRRQLADFCRKHHILRLSLFGSVLREDFGPQSDVDVLVEFEPGHAPGFIRLHFMEEELAGLLGGRRVDVVTPKCLNHRIRRHVLAAAEVQYAQG
jgi:hypothetical protein